MKKIIIFVIIIFISILHAGVTLACKVGVPDVISVATSLQQKKSFSYGTSRVESAFPNSTISRCQNTAIKRKYLMIAIGPQIVGLIDRHVGASFNGVYDDDGCKIKNNPMANLMPFSERKSNFNKNFLYTTNCLDVFVEHWGSKPLDYPDEQPGCKVTKISEQSAYFRGGYCFFKPSFDSTYNVKVLIRKECHNSQYLKDLGINPTDLSAFLNYYTASDATGTSLDLQAIESSTMRISINPYKATFPVSDDYGILNPTWPARWIVPDVNIGEITIRNSSTRYDHLKVPLFVDNRCLEVCNEGVCSSPCEYSSPVAAEFTLYEFRRNKRDYITSWYDGGIALAKWQGLLTGVGVDVPKNIIEKGKRYEVEIIFRDPHIDFIMLKRRYKNLLGNFNLEIGRIRRTGRIGTIPLIPNIPTDEELPIIREIDNIDFTSSLDGVKRAVLAFEAHLNYRLWPPFIEDICNADYSICTSLRGKLLTLKASFTVKDFDEKTKNFGLENITVKRKSKYLDDYTRTVIKQPKVVCE